MIEVFRTNIEEPARADEIAQLLYRKINCQRVNFDLEDCDRVLRIEGSHFRPDLVIMLLKEKGLECSILE